MPYISVLFTLYYFKSEAAIVVKRAPAKAVRPLPVRSQALWLSAVSFVWPIG